VLDGRDIGTFVLPDANCKFFMTATPEERATRRYKELIGKGQQVDFDTILSDIQQRDYNDSHRAVAPLKQADDADFVDTTDMDIEDVVAHIKQVVHIKTKPVSQEQKNAESKAEEKPMSKSMAKRMKKYYQPQKRFCFYRFMRLFMRPLQAILWPIKIVNKQNAKIEGKAVYTCNHYSKVDTFIPCFALFKKEAHILAKYELFKVPIAGWFLHKMGAIPVRRGEADISAVKSVLGVLKEDKKLMIFPEGTRNKSGSQEMAEFKTGTARFAIKTKAPIVPMLYYSSPKLFRRNWLYVGEPFTLEEYYGARTPEQMHAATDVIQQKMQDIRVQCNEYVENLKKGKKKK
nr:(d)CMP kinase [Clostridia bacterium]